MIEGGPPLLNRILKIIQKATAVPLSREMFAALESIPSPPSLAEVYLALDSGFGTDEASVTLHYRTPTGGRACVFGPSFTRTQMACSLERQKLLKEIESFAANVFGPYSQRSSR